MSVEAMAVVLHHSRAKGTEKVILLGIANHEGDGGAWPALPTLARYANVDERTVRRAVRNLEEMGEVSTEQRGGRGLSNRYVVTVRCPVECDRTTAHRLIHTPDAHVPVSGEGAHVPPDAHVPPTPDAHVPPGGTPTSPEPSMNHPMNQSGGPATASSTDRVRQVVDLTEVRRQIRSSRVTS